MMKIIIHCKGIDYDCFYDECDHELISKYKWTLSSVRKYGHTRYAQTSIYVNGKQTTIGMHRLILGSPKDIIDHKDRNGLNNCRDNLRLSDLRLNRLNSNINRDNTTGETNINLCKKSNRYYVKIQVRVKGKRLSLFFGSYRNINDAVKERNFHKEHLHQMNLTT